MDEKLKTLLMTIAYQRQSELIIAMSQLDQAVKMAKDPKEREFLAAQREQMAYMYEEIKKATDAVSM